MRVFWLKKHKHMFRYKGRYHFGQYKFECESCGERYAIYPWQFWDKTPKNPAAIWLWNNA